LSELCAARRAVGLRLRGHREERLLLELGQRRHVRDGCLQRLLLTNELATKISADACELVELRHELAVDVSALNQALDLTDISAHSLT
jgi:hypothetical protein